MSSTPEPDGRRYEPTHPDELLARAKRRSLALRRHRLLGAGGSLAVVLALVLGSVLIPGSGAPGSRLPGKTYSADHRPGQIYVAERIGSAYELTANEAPATTAPPIVVRRVGSAEVSFSLDLLKQLAGPAASDNVLVSPSSLSTALAMLELGASGSTERGIAAALRSEGLSATAQAAGWRGLAALLASETSPVGADAARLPELDVANAVWIQQNLDVRAAFVRALSSEFRTGTWRVNFADDLPGAVAAINQWTSQNTKGLIKQLFSPGTLDKTTELVLANAVFFHADWAHRFRGATGPEPFQLATGGTESVPFMSSTPAHPLSVPFSSTERYVAVQLPYAGHKLSALVVMPTRSSLASFVSSLTPGSLGRLVRAMPVQSLALSMPTFTLRADNQLNQVLSSMGMSQAFGIGADFGGIAANQSLYVKAVEQHAYLQVTPRGTTAAAATGIGVVSSAYELPKFVHINRPFLFLVRDNSSGAILFESMVENPAS